MRELKFASIGGWHVHTERFIDKVNDYPGCEVSVIWDPEPERGMERANKYNCEYVEKLREGLMIVSHKCGERRDSCK